MEKPDVSIITPCYNSARFLDVAINSVLNQTYSSWELLIIDDCSTDTSLNIIHEYCIRDKRIKCFVTNTPSGSPTLPRNMGVEKARGKYIAFLDSDDVWLPNKLEEELTLFSNPKVAIVYSDYEKISEEGERKARLIIAPVEVNYDKLLLGNVIGCLTAVYDTNKVGKVYFENINHEDYVLWLSILKRGYIAMNTQTVTALYRIRKHSVSSSKMKVLSWQWNIYVKTEKLTYLKAIYCFCNYAVRAYIKNII